MISFKNFKKFLFTFYNILKIFIITSIKKKKNNSVKFFFFYFPVKAYQENILELGEFIAKSKNFEVYYIYNSNTKIELKLKKNSLYLDFNYIRFIPFGNFFLNKINFLISSYVIYTFPPKSKNIYICHDIYDAPMAKKYIEKKIFIELAKLDYIFVSSDIVKDYFEKGLSKNIMNKSKRKVQIVNTGYLKLDHVHKKINLRKVKEDSILIAPTSSKFYSDANLSKKLDKLINLLLEEKYKIIYRPHPMDLTIKGDINLTNLIIEKFKDFQNGITLTATGFYGPQARELRLASSIDNLQELIEKINYKKLQITNLEMETSALYFLGRSLGHNTITICAILANRLKQEYSKEPKKLIDHLIKEVLNKL